MNNDIGSQVDRPLQHRSTKTIVDRKKRARLVSERRQRRDI
jgi:hypothetical protein